MRPFDPRLVRHASAARGYLILTVCLGFCTTALVLAQASLLAHALAAAARGLGLSALHGAVAALALGLLARALAAFGGEGGALRRAPRGKSRRRRRRGGRAL